jgi:hypothetical protein
MRTVTRPFPKVRLFRSSLDMLVRRRRGRTRVAGNKALKHHEVKIFLLMSASLKTYQYYLWKDTLQQLLRPLKHSKPCGRMFP